MVAEILDSPMGLRDLRRVLNVASGINRRNIPFSSVNCAFSCVPPVYPHKSKMSQNNSAIKYILVTGGVISGVGKGVIASSFGTILKCCGIHVTSIKIDPYINIDAGTFSPYEHGKKTQSFHCLIFNSIGIISYFHCVRLLKNQFKSNVRPRGVRPCFDCHLLFLTIFILMHMFHRVSLFDVIKTTTLYLKTRFFVLIAVQLFFFY